MKRIVRAGLIALAVATSLPALSQPAPVSVERSLPQQNAAYLLPDGSVALGGAEHVSHILKQLSTRFSVSHPNIRFTDVGKGTTSAVPLLTYDRILFGSMGRGIDPLEAAAYAKIVGAPPLEIRIAHTSDDTSNHLATSLAVYVHHTNPITRFTMSQLRRVMTVGNPEGDVSRWGQLGLDKPWHERTIHRYGTAPFTGFGSYMQSEQYDGRALAPNYEVYENTKTILARLEQDPAGIAVAALGSKSPNLRQLALASGEDYSLGSREDVRLGRYPLGRYLLVYLRKRPGLPVDPLAKTYMQLVLSPEGQAIIAAQENGYIPLTSDEAAAELAKLDCL